MKNKNMLNVLGRFNRIIKHMVIILCLYPPLASAGEIYDVLTPHKFENAMSFEGFTGVLTTPSAHVTREGDFFAQYTNYKESKWRNKVPFQDNYQFNVGFFSFAEITGNLFDAPGVNRDLSASVKFTTEPIFRDKKFMPVFAAGMQDLSGGASFLKSKYLVVSEDLWRLRLSAGYGNGPDRMKGGFAGAEFKAHDSVYLLADYDTKETNVGLRVITPHFWKVPISFTATAITSLDYKPGNVDVSVGFTLPFDFKVRKGIEKNKNVEPVLASKTSTIEIEKNIVKPDNTGAIGAKSEFKTDEKESSKSDELKVDSSTYLANLQEKLVQEGFLNVKVGEIHPVAVVIEYENVIFNHNELDALGLVLGRTLEIVPKNVYQQIKIVIKKKNISLMQLAFPFDSSDQFMNRGGKASDLVDRLSVKYGGDDKTAINYLKKDSPSSHFLFVAELWPGLSTIVGTAENGQSNFEYKLSMKPDLYLNLWDGALINARWDIPVSWSDYMDDGKNYSTMDRLIFQQGVKLLPNVMLNLGAGMVGYNLNGTVDEFLWSIGDGSNRIRGVYGYAKDSDTKQIKESYIASYRYYLSPFDLSLEANYGKFWYQDRGIALSLKRFFGDASFGVYYKNTKTVDSKKWEAVGVEFAFPLTPRRDMKPFAKVQIRGTEEWVYGQETTIANKSLGGKNYLSPTPLAITPTFTTSLYSQYLDRERLNPSYIRAHIGRLREAWEKFGN